MGKENSNISVTCDEKQDVVTLRMPVQCAQFVKLAVNNLGVELVRDQAFHAEGTELSLAASTTSINMNRLWRAMSEAGVP